MSSRMEQIIEEIEEYVDHCKPAPLSSGKILVNKEELMELISELRSKTPEEIKRYQKIISNKEAILADAQAKADQIIAQAQVQTTELVSEHQIMQHNSLACTISLVRDNELETINRNATSCTVSYLDLVDVVSKRGLAIQSTVLVSDALTSDTPWIHGRVSCQVPFDAINCDIAVTSVTVVRTRYRIQLVNRSILRKTYQ